MNNFKAISFSLIEASMFFMSFWLVLNYSFNMPAPLFWIVFSVLVVGFQFIIMRRQEFWMRYLDKQWCIKNKWWYSPDKNSAIYWEWAGTIKEAERVCRERVALQNSELS